MTSTHTTTTPAATGFNGPTVDEQDNNRKAAGAAGIRTAIEAIKANPPAGFAPCTVCGRNTCSGVCKICRVWAAEQDGKACYQCGGPKETARKTYCDHCVRARRNSSRRVAVPWWARARGDSPKYAGCGN